MILTPLDIQGAFLMDLDRRQDDRGYFARCYCREELLAHGVRLDIAQCSLSGNTARHTLRGMHYQAAPHGETKLVRCSAGRIWDCIADLRPGSPTFLRWTAHELSAANGRALLVPEQCAHGFLTLEPGSEVLYLISTPYEPAAARGLRWNDPALGIDWPAQPEVISDRDRAYPDFKLEDA